MATKPKEPTKTDGATALYGPFASFFAGAMNGNKAFLGNGFHAAQEQAFDFAIRRLHHTEEALEECKGCSDVLALANVQQKWITETMQDYFEQFSRFSDNLRGNTTGASSETLRKAA